MNRRIFNVRLAALLFFGIIVLAVGTHLLHGMQVKRTAVVLRERADRAEKEGKLDQALDYIGRYLSFRPNDVDGLLQYARILEKGGETEESRQKVLGIYTKTLRLAPERNEIRRRLIDSYLKSGEFSDAKTQLEFLLHAMPKDPELVFLLGRCEEGAGHYREAAALYDQARTLDPTKVEASTRLAGLLRQRLNGADQADRVMDARQEKDGLIASNRKSAPAYLARAIYRERYAVPGVDPAADVARALELAPDDLEVLLAASRLALAKNDTETARRHLEHGIERHPDATSLYEALAALEGSSGEVDKSAEWLRRGLKRLSADNTNDRARLNWTLADLLIRAGRPDQAEEVITQLRAERLRPGLVEYLDATNLAARRKWADAAAALSNVSPVLGGEPSFKGYAKRALILLGGCYERLGNKDQRLDAYRNAVAIELDPDPLKRVARFGLASALIALDKVDEAIDEYRRMPNDLGAEMAMARVQILRNIRRPDDQRRWDEVGRSLEAVEQGLKGRDETGRGAAEVAVLRAELLATQGRLGPAREQLRRRPWPSTPMRSTSGSPWPT